jgi:YesN/AraC family two-component response regulator
MAHLRNGVKKVAQRIKEEFPKIPTVILTGCDLPEYRQAAVQYGADTSLVKEPLEREEVEELVKSFELSG